MHRQAAGSLGVDVFARCPTTAAVNGTERCVPTVGPSRGLATAKLWQRGTNRPSTGFFAVFPQMCRPRSNAKLSARHRRQRTQRPPAESSGGRCQRSASTCRCDDAFRRPDYTTRLSVITHTRQPMAEIARGGGEFQGARWSIERVRRTSGPDHSSTGGTSLTPLAAGEVVPVLVVAAVLVPAEDVVVLGVAVEVLGVDELTVVESSGCTKTTVSEPALASGCTWTSATNAPGSPQGSAPAGPTVPASWVTFPRKR